MDSVSDKNKYHAMREDSRTSAMDSASEKNQHHAIREDGISAMDSVSDENQYYPIQKSISGGDVFAREPLVWLPKWAIAADVRKFMQNNVDRQRGLITASNVVGPAIRWQYLELSVLWCLFTGLPFLAFWATPCPDTSAGTSYAMYPTWLWFPVLPILTICMMIEANCLRYVMPPWLYNAKSIWLFGLKMSRFPFVVWSGLSLMLSFVNHLDIVTNGFFVAQALRSHVCPEVSTRIDDVWKKVLAESTLRDIPFVMQISFEWFALVMWSFMFFQLMYGLGYTIPLTPGRLNYDIGVASGELASESLNGTTKRYKYNTLLASGINHDCVVQQLAMTGRMASLSSHIFTVFKSKLNHYTSNDREHLSHRQLKLVSGSLRHSTHRLLLVGILENSIMLNLQVTHLAIDHFLTGRVSAKMEFSVYLTALLSCLRIWDALALLRFIKRIWPEFGSQTEDMVYSRSTVKRQVILNVCITFVFALIILYAVAKAVAIHVCPDGLLNLNGCASVPRK
eukprot:TRINITY_DN33130_c0_g1_i1.p1 TRINITY_DN33130_c0_g1~~TRINITY_DN33130_c0_g1_i1.p1  ORF type:complete len:509 (+),score=52.14 TRINITY_DN33130_c0_g1_i1:80-1606(+)